MKHKNARTFPMQQSGLISICQNNPQYVKLIIANAISRFGDSIDMIAFSWLIYEITGSASWSAVVVGVNQLTSVVFQPFAGSIVEHRNKKKIMVTSDCIRFLAILAFIILYRVGCAGPWLLITFTGLISLVETFRIPSGVSIIPSLLKREDYDIGISTNNAISKVCELLGLVSAGLFIALIGTSGAMIVDGVTFLLSGILIFFIKYQFEINPKENKEHNYFKMTKDGIRFLLSQKMLFLICIICGVINASVIPFDSLQSAFVNMYFNEKVYVLSAISIAMSIGMLLGSASYHKVVGEKAGVSILAIGGVSIGFYYLIISGIVMIDLPVSENLLFILRVIAVVGVSFVVGIAISFMNNYVQIFFVKEVSQEYLSRISAISTTITTIFSPVTAFFISLLAVKFETASLLSICGILIVLCFGILYVQLKQAIKTDNRQMV